MKKLMHIYRMLIIVVAMVVMSASGSAATKQVMPDVDVDTCAPYAKASDGGALIDGDEAFVIDGVMGTIDGSLPMRVCNERPVRNLQVRSVSGRFIWSLALEKSDFTDVFCAHMETSMEMSSSHTPVFASANDRIVALRRIIR
ncbi:MAG: hypothetical protein MR850_06125 [Bacteroidales bacterium]|nr:hypothetical protein [Bacteroidales bacterium]